MDIHSIRELDPKLVPESLFEIPQPPKTLFIRGNFPDKEKIFLCVVGSRKFTSYGRDACEKLIEGLRGYPVVIVSGLAMGIDSIAHKKAMEVGLTTLAFPGSGLMDKVIFPTSNVPLARKIVESGGAIISEFPNDFKATLYSFPQRNRIMAGISKAVLIIEAEEKSGTLITARLAVEYNRDVLVVPGSINSPTSKGTNRLIRQGATPITNSDELLEALGFEVDNKKMVQQELFNCTDDEKKVLEILREPFARDELIRLLKKPTHEANALLSIMEIKGLIKEELGEIRKV